MAKHGGDPSWQSWLQSQADMIRQVEHDGGLSAEDIERPGKIPYWPIPSQMLKDPGLKTIVRHSSSISSIGCIDRFLKICTCLYLDW